MKEKLQCDNCGGVLDHENNDIFGCKYCGMKYKITGWVERRTFAEFVNKIEQEYPPLQKIVVKPSDYTIINAKVEVNGDCSHLYYSKEDYNKLIKRALVDQISSYIYNNIDDIATIYEDTDIYEMKTVYSTRIKVSKEERRW